MSKLNYIRNQLYLKATGASHDLEMGPIKDGRLYLITHCAAISETNNVAKVRVIVNSHGQDHFRQAQNDPQGNILYPFDDNFHMTVGEKLIFRWTGVHANDILRCFYEGYWSKIAET